MAQGTTGTGARPAAAEPQAPPPVASVHEVSKQFGPTRALRDVSLTVTSGRTHALLGRNGAGKSTLVSVLTGLTRPDRGRVEFLGRPAPATADRAAWQPLVACVYQRSSVVPTMSVAENLFLARHAVGPPVISWRRMHAEAAHLLAEWDLPVDPRARVDTLAVGSRQLVEIARGLSSGSRFVILDEPTAKLDAREAGRLFDRMQRLKRSGVTFLYISHHLHEIYEVCEDVTVLRDGAAVGVAAVEDMPPERVVELMTGSSDAATVTRRTAAAPPGDAIVVVRGLTAAAGAVEPFEDVDLSIRAGEVLGLAGLDGSGKLGVAEALVGRQRPARGTVAVAGRPLRPGRIDISLRHGVGFVPEDRQTQGLVPQLSVAENITLTATRDLGRAGVVEPRRRRTLAAGLVARLGVAPLDPSLPVSALSGGNQQKVLLGRALATRPRVLVLIKPTAGVDVRSKRALLESVDAAAAAGAAVLVVSDEIEDLAVCHRVQVMFRGRTTAHVDAGWSDDRLISAIEGVGHVDG